MTLNDVWFAIFVVVVAGYLILDGFDMGVGILHLPLARTDVERRTFLNAIGPIWDGNEVWLILGGGILFAVFPLVYASLFSGLYLAFTLVLLVMILRTVSLEFRSKEPGRRWRQTWDTVFALASLGLALLLGVAFGDVLSGLPVDQQGNIAISLFDALKPFPLLVGVTTVLMFAMHGSIYLTMKTEGELRARVQRATPRLMAAFFVANTLVVIAMVLFHERITATYTEQLWPALFPAAALAAMLSAWRLQSIGRYGWAFVASAAMILLLIVSGSIGLYPNLVISTIDPAYSLTIFNAASADNTLFVALVIALIGMPFVLLYTAGAYYIFRGPVRVDEHGY